MIVPVRAYRHYPGTLAGGSASDSRPVAVRLVGIGVSGPGDTGLVQRMLFDRQERQKQSRADARRGRQDQGTLWNESDPATQSHYVSLTSEEIAPELRRVGTVLGTVAAPGPLAGG
jgi:hypothetical protein